MTMSKHSEASVLRELQLTVASCVAMSLSYVSWHLREGAQ